MFSAYYIVTLMNIHSIIMNFVVADKKKNLVMKKTFLMLQMKAVQVKPPRVAAAQHGKADSLCCHH